MMKREEKKKADDEEKKRLEAVPTIPEDGASGAGGSAVAGEHGQNEVGTTFDVTTFQVGDIVMGHAKKKKENFDMQECRITAVLAKQYKVLMTSGAATGTDHKYLHEDANTQPGTPSVMLRDGSEPTQLQPDAASGSTKVEAESQPLDDVF